MFISSSSSGSLGACDVNRYRHHYHSHHSHHHDDYDYHQGAWEPVNVDAAARTSAQEIEIGTGEEKELFLASQVSNGFDLFVFKIVCVKICLHIFNFKNFRSRSTTL